MITGITIEIPNDTSVPVSMVPYIIAPRIDEMIESTKKIINSTRDQFLPLRKPHAIANPIIAKIKIIIPMTTHVIGRLWRTSGETISINSGGIPSTASRPAAANMPIAAISIRIDQIISKAARIVTPMGLRQTRLYGETPESVISKILQN